MNAKTYTVSLQSRVAAAFFAVLASAMVLGATVAGFQPATPEASVVVMDRVTVRAAAIN
jgi:hypothetical protein